MDRFIGQGRLSVHEVGLADLLDIARLTGHLPQRRALIGIQPQITDWGEGLSAAVQHALPRAAETAMDLLTKWGAA